ncbi:unnamed protein product [Rotaria socialis]|uniref:Major facilitator superfamily (MFS) profile domain-containing protein n=2 Tax=Rotaria socialis TaxID=392032 RepID=A0A818PHY4_9BILA|nr:unnamed protein product [Rotaria socialis]CAF3362657.1 unnamed protein product [Rotaria socialis]CAF3466272.1 unnamed protein product [Rotaria socialis]CAF3621456.1 unnamed protein product [Rotaria socialis]CAF3687605.1 unnamed protein product [Rotaria socialis]
MEPNDSSTRDCSTIYRFQFASIAFLCSVYLPFTFHSNIWSLYTQPFSPVNCSLDKSSFLSGSTANVPTKLTPPLFSKNQNRSGCCPCRDFLNGNVNDKRLWLLCQSWIANKHELEERKATIIEEWHLACGEENQRSLLIGSISFLIAEIIGVIIIGILADQYGRKLMLLMCLYIPVIFGSLSAFTTTYSLFLILRWPVGFLNRGLLLLGFVMVIESCEYKHRAQIGCLLLASIPAFGIIIGVTYFFLLDWRHMQLLGSLITTLTLCYPWLIPESRRWYVNSHRISRVNKLLQLCSNKQGPTLSLNNKIGSPAPTTMIYDKPILSPNTLRVQASSTSSLLIDQQLRTITCCLFILWFLASFCYRCVFFPILVSHPTINYVLMNATEFFSFIIALLVAYKIGRRAPLAVLILISGLSSVSLAISLLGTGHMWLEITLSIVARVCLRTCYCLLILFTTELYPTSVRATGLAIGLASDIIARIVVEELLFLTIDRLLLLFISGGILCLSCCLILPLPETILYDIPDSISDLQSMKCSPGNDDENKISPQATSHYHMTESSPRKLPRISESSTITSDLNDISPLNPKTIIKSQQQGDGDEKSQTIRFQPETIQLHSNTSTIKGLSNPCYFSLVNDTIDTYDIEQQANNRVVISIRGLQNNNNNNEEEREVTKF